MKAYLIKPREGEIVEVEFAGTLEDAYRLIEAPIVERIEALDHDIWIDEEGLFRASTQEKGHFSVKGTYGFYDRVSGYGLVTGRMRDDDDEETFGPATMSLDTLKKIAVLL